MSREVEDINPYEANIAEQDSAPVPSLVSRHEWRGRVLTVEANAVPLFAYQSVQYSVTLDGYRRFTGAKLRIIDEFEWQFSHEGRTVIGRFATKGLNSIFVTRFRLWIDGELIAESKVRIRDSWKELAVFIGFGFVILIAIVVGLLIKEISVK